MTECPIRPMISIKKHIYHCNDWNQDTKVSCAAWCLERQITGLSTVSTSSWTKHWINHQRHTFRAGPLSEALSLALFPSRPNWTKSSSRLTSSSSTICSDWRLAAILPRALITAKEQCLCTEAGKVKWVYNTFLFFVICVLVTCIHGPCSLW